MFTDPIPSRETRSFPAQMRAFPQAAAFIEEVSAAAGFSRDDRHKLTLALEELFTNTVMHGYGGDSDQPVWLTVETGIRQITLHYEDSAPAHNPFERVKMPDFSVPVDKLQVGGLGMVLVTKFACHVAYSYSEGRNRLTMIFAPSQPSR
ncbi:MAG: ATP-binding protein [Burkholderiales bacterium]